MDKYLLEILKDVNTIIIPGLGALTITNSDTCEIMFMSYLKHDDGKLASYISEKEGMNEIEAKNLIAKYVREIQAKLNIGESYDIFQFGSFVKDNDEINFRSWEGESIKEEVPKKNTKAVKKNEETKTEKKETSEATSKVEIIDSGGIEKKTEKAISKEVEQQNETEYRQTPFVEEKDKTQPVIVEAEPTKTNPTKETEKVFNILEKEELNTNITKLENLKKNNATPKEKKKRGIGFYMLMVLVVFIVAGGTYVGLNFKEVRQHIPFLADKKMPANNDGRAIEKMKEMLGETSDKKEEENEENINQEKEAVTVKNEEQATKEMEPVEDVIIPEPKKRITEPSLNNSGFHIIAGAFSSEGNAERLAGKMRQLGYSVKVGKGRGMNLVSIKSYSTEEEANTGLTEVRADAPKAWVYEWK